MSEIELGQEVRDTVSGFQGIAVCRHIYLNGCARISIQPPVDKEGKLPEVVTLDEPQLEVIKKETGIEKSKDEKSPGGSAHYTPSPRHEPKR
jgi:hypothetical protein